MSDSKAPKIVVAVALAAVYGTGLAMVTLRDSPDSHTVQNAAAAPATQAVEQPASEVIPAAEIVASPENVSTDVIAQSLKPTVASNPKTPGVAKSAEVERTAIDRPNPAVQVASVGIEPAITAVDAPSSGQLGSASSSSVSQANAEAEAQVQGDAPVDTAGAALDEDTEAE